MDNNTTKVVLNNKTMYVGDLKKNPSSVFLSAYEQPHT